MLSSILHKPQNYYNTNVLLQCGLFIFRFYLKFRMRQSFLTTTIPASLTKIPDTIVPAGDANRNGGNVLSVVTQEQFEKTQAYGLAKSTFELISMAKNFAVRLIATKLQSKLWYWLRDSVPFLKARPEGSFAHTLTYCVAGEVIETLIDLPFDYYFHFVLEEKYGFNKQTPGTFVKDLAKSFLLKACLLHPIQTGIISFTINKWGKSFPKYLFAATASLVFAASFVVPTLIMPLFYKFTPLPEGSSLHTKIQDLSKKVEYPLTKIYEMDASSKSAHSNAFMYGFWKNKRIVLFDTLLKQLSETEICAVLAHELGHWFHGHTLKMMLVNLFHIGAICFLAREVIFEPQLYADFGYGPVSRRDSANAPSKNDDRLAIPSPVIGFELFSDLVWGPVGEILGVLMVLASRRFEFQADEFACQQGFGKELYIALTKINKENLGSITPDWLYAALRFSHPILPERLDFIEGQVRKRM